MRRSLGIAIFSLTVGGLVESCAGTSVRDVSDKTNKELHSEADKSARGIRYYEKAPFVLVHSDGKGGLVTQLIYLEDTTRKRSIQPFAVLSKNKTELTFSNGVLTDSNTEIDETAVPIAFLDAAQNVAMAAAKLGVLDSAGSDGATTVEFPAPALYRIVKLDDGSFALRGGVAHKPGQPQTPQNIQITIPAPASN
jgi:hypothetical protein